ncbi:hydroxyacid dehydrogenase [Paraburkholderia kururiensis]|uniref:hydroxyacid dehydrogenase n=1 Tax=Paraburkholderia kururiensis TaxID=984307 RepID=UPI0005A6DC9C|nr:hydroxyacid dehydrogenase [Paraburkholderia kururiensis]
MTVRQTTSEGGKKRLLVAHILGQTGKDMLAARKDIEIIEFSNTLEQNAFRALLAAQPAVHGVILGLTGFGRTELEAASDLQVVSRIGVGYDAVDIAAMTEAGIPVMICTNANCDTVAEHTLFSILALAKRALELDALVRMSRWHDRYRYLPGEVRGREVLIVGFGRIGTRVARLCNALGMHVRVYDPYVANDAIHAAGADAVDDLDTALTTADFVTLHCPKTRETTGMFDAARLERFKRGAFLVNTARGGIVDECALADRLTSGHIAGAAIDVFLPEPPMPGNPLLEMSNVICSPHLAGVTREAVERMAQLAVANALSVLDGHPRLENAVNPGAFTALTTA